MLHILAIVFSILGSCAGIYLASLIGAIVVNVTVMAFMLFFGGCGYLLTRWRK